jgi:hypothetical protein
MRQILVGIMVLTILPAQLAQRSEKKAAPGASEEVLRVENQRVKALLEGDTAVLESLLADALTYTHSTSQMDTKREFVHKITSGELKYESLAHEEVGTRVFGNVAVLTGRSSVKVSSARTPGEVRSFRIRFTNVYWRESGRWRQVAWQSTRIPES